MQKTLKNLREEEQKKLSKNIIEALLFASSEPLPIEKLVEIVDEPLHLVESYLNELKTHYKEEHSFQLDEIAGGYILRTQAIFGTYVEKLKERKRSPKLSNAAVEVLAIVAHKQPVTRSGIENIRGVDSSQILHTLLERELIEQVGKEEAPGRPSLYGVTPKFLHHFGLKDLSELRAH